MPENGVEPSFYERAKREFGNPSFLELLTRLRVRLIEPDKEKITTALTSWVKNGLEGAPPIYLTGTLAGGKLKTVSLSENHLAYLRNCPETLVFSAFQSKEGLTFLRKVFFKILEAKISAIPPSVEEKLGLKTIPFRKEILKKPISMLEREEIFYLRVLKGVAEKLSESIHSFFLEFQKNFIQVQPYIKLNAPIKKEMALKSKIVNDNPIEDFMKLHPATVREALRRYKRELEYEREIQKVLRSRKDLNLERDIDLTI